MTRLDDCLENTLPSKLSLLLWFLLGSTLYAVSRQVAYWHWYMTAHVMDDERRTKLTALILLPYPYCILLGFGLACLCQSKDSQKALGERSRLNEGPFRMRDYGTHPI